MTTNEQPRRVGAGVKVVAFAATLLFSLVLLDHVLAAFVPPMPPPRVAHTPNTVKQNENVEFAFDWRTNSMGLRSDELPLERTNPNEFRMIVVGDSMTEGTGVEAVDRFSNRIEAALNSDRQPVHVINAGLGGQGPLQFGRVLFTVGMRYKPNLAVFVIHANDLNDTAEDARLDLRRDGDVWSVAGSRLRWEPGGPVHRVASWLMPWSYGRLQYWSMQQDDQALQALSFLEAIDERARRQGIPAGRVHEWKASVPAWLIDASQEKRFNGSAVAHGLFEPDFWLKNLDVHGPAAIAQWTAMEGILSNVAALCKEVDLRCAFVYTPTLVQFDPTGGDLERAVGVHLRPEWLTETSEVERRLDAWAERLQVPYLSLTDAFREVAAADPGSLAYQFDGHYNPNGHRLTADLIVAWLHEQRLAP